MKALIVPTILAISAASFSTGAVAGNDYFSYLVPKTPVKSHHKQLANAARVALYTQERLVNSSREPILMSTTLLALSAGGVNATAIVWTCTSDTKVGQDECAEIANNYTIDDGATCGSIEGGVECEIPEGDD